MLNHLSCGRFFLAEGIALLDEMVTWRDPECKDNMWSVLVTSLSDYERSKCLFWLDYLRGTIPETEAGEYAAHANDEKVELFLGDKYAEAKRKRVEKKQARLAVVAALPPRRQEAGGTSLRAPASTSAAGVRFQFFDASSLKQPIATGRGKSIVIAADSAQIARDFLLGSSTEAIAALKSFQASIASSTKRTW